MNDIRYDGNVPLGEIHIVETANGRLNVKSCVFESEELVAVMYTVLWEFLSKFNNGIPTVDFDVILNEIGKMIFQLMEEKNKLVEAIEQAIELLSVDGQGTKQEVKKMLSEVLGNDK